MDAAAFGGVVAGTLVWLHARDSSKRKTRLPDLQRYIRKAELLKQGGPDSLQIIVDFDRTITTHFFESGVRGASCHGIVEHTWQNELRAKAEALNAFYGPIETDPHMNMVRSCLDLGEQTAFAESAATPWRRQQAPTHGCLTPAGR